MAKVFLSHSSKDRELADAIRAKIGTRHDLFLDHDPEAGIQPGAEWERTLYERLQWADAVICVVTQHHIDSRWCFAEVAIAKAQGRLLLPLAAEAGVRHPLLEPSQGVDYATDAKTAMDRIIQRLATLDAAGGLAWDSTRPAFPGLAAFDTDDRPMFFGRDAQVARLAADLRSRDVQREPRAVVVIGASGSGKSSLVRAGLVPRLLDDASWWRVRPIMPGRNPMAVMAAEFARARKEVGLAPDLQRMTDILSQGTGEFDGIARELLVSAPGECRRLLLVVDQLEEIFTRASDADRVRFLTVLADAASNPDGAVVVVATLRSEFLTHLLKAPEAAPLRHRPFGLPPLGQENLEEVISLPARKAGITFAEDLVRRLVQDTGTGEALPLLAFTLARLVVEGVQAGEHIGVDRYWRIGGVQGAVNSQAENALAAAIKAARCTELEVMNALLAFVTLDDTGKPTRRRRRRDDLDAMAAAVAAAFVEARLITSDTDDDGTVLGVVHETLFSAWPRLVEAIKAAAADLRLRRSLERDSAEWEREGKPPSLWWHGERLARARTLVQLQRDLGPQALAFVSASAQAEEEALRRESEMLADRVVGANLPASDSELALLYLLAAADGYAITPDVVATLRRTLALHRLVGRVGPFDRRALSAAIADDGQRVAVADLGTNEDVRPSTRPTAPRPAGVVNLTVWHLGEAASRLTVPIAGRDVTAMAWSRDGASILVGVDTRVVWLDGASGAVRRMIKVGMPVVSLDLARNNLQLLVEMRGDQLRLIREIEDWLVPLVPPEAGEIRRLFGEAPAAISPPSRFSHLIPCPYASRLLDLEGDTLDVWAADPVDHPVELKATELGEVSWLLIPEIPRPSALLAGGPGGRIRCSGSPLRLLDTVSGVERLLPWGSAMAASFSGDGRRLALASRTRLAIFDVSTAGLVTEFGRHSDEEGDVYSSVSLNHDGTALASGSLGGGRSKLWTVETGQAGIHIGARSVAFSADGNFIGAATSFACFVFNPRTGERIELGNTAASSFVFAPDRSAVVAVEENGATEFSLPDANVAAHYPGPIEAIAFTLDSHHVLTRIDGRIQRWPDRTPEAVITRARAAVFRKLNEEERSRFELRRAD